MPLPVAALGTDAVVTGALRLTVARSTQRLGTVIGAAAPAAAEEPACATPTPMLASAAASTATRAATATLTLTSGHIAHLPGDPLAVSLFTCCRPPYDAE